MPIPEFNDIGYLPPGVYETNWQEFMQRFVTNSHRQRLATGLAAAPRKLGIAGCRRVIIGGSFVTNKEKPNDFDGWYDDFHLDPDTLDPLFVDNINDQQLVFGGRLFDLPNYEVSFKLIEQADPRE